MSSTYGTPYQIPVDRGWCNMSDKALLSAFGDMAPKQEVLDGIALSGVPLASSINGSSELSDPSESRIPFDLNEISQHFLTGEPQRSPAQSGQAMVLSQPRQSLAGFSSSSAGTNSCCTSPEEHRRHSHSRKRKASASATGSSSRSSASPPPAGQPPKKTAHNMIEKRYRTNLNDKISALRDAVPALRVAAQRLEQQTEVVADEDLEAEELDGLAPAHKLNKATILSKATEYIAHLERRNQALGHENSQLRHRVGSLEMMAIGRVHGYGATWV